MKSRRVVLTVEVDTDLSLEQLLKAAYIQLFARDPQPVSAFKSLKVEQLQANVIRAPKSKKGGDR